MNDNTLKGLLGAQSALGPRWNSTGDTLCFVWNVSGRHQVYTMSAGGAGASWPIQISSGERGTDPRWLPGDRIVFSADVGGDECFQIFVAEADGSVRRISPDDRAKYHVLYNDDVRIIFSSNERDKSSFELYELPADAQSWNPKPIYDMGRGIIASVQPLPGSDSLVVNQMHGSMHSDIMIINAAGSSQVITANYRKRFSTLRCYEHGILVASDVDSDKVRPVFLRLDGSVEQIPSWDEASFGEAESASFAPGSDDTYVSGNAGGYDCLVKMTGLASPSAAQCAKIDLPVSGVFSIGDARSSSSAFAVSPDGATIAAGVSSSVDVPNIWLYDIGGEGWTQRTYASAPGVAAAMCCPETLHSFTSSDGETIPYFRFLPPEYQSGEASPAIFVIHGGPEGQTTTRFDPIIQFFAAQGFAVIAPNIRGSSGYGRRYLDLDNGPKRLDSIRDIAELAAHLSANDKAIDGERLGIFGISYGGYAVLASLTEYPEIWKAGVDIVGMSSLLTFLRNTADWRRPFREAEYGKVSEEDMLNSVSPINKIDRISAPLLIIQGDNDERVPLSESVQMHEKLTKLGKTVELIRFADEGHGVTILENKLVAYSRTAEWFVRYVAG